MLIYAIRDFWDDYKNSRNEPKIPIVKADNIQVIGRRAKAQSIKETMKPVDVPQIRDQRPKPEAKVIKSIPKITKPLAPACKDGRAQRKAPIVVFKFEDENKKHSRPAGQHNGYNYQVIGQGGFATVYKVTHQGRTKGFRCQEIRSRLSRRL
ncbi:hypothetical protein QCA50_010581 [Cerrena zonata]|uniref:Protein kinase domain-containing protein n=1 Tax=Cerrena zonata TaxID=2478898 RepID=A0AAW0G4B0_9APHY